MKSVKERSYSFKRLLGFNFSIQPTDYENNDYEYDSFGKLIKKTNYLKISQKKIGFINEFKYDETGRLIEEKLLSGNGEISEFIKYYYNINFPENLDSFSSSKFDIRHVYYELEKNRITKSREIWQQFKQAEIGETTEFYYDTNGNITQEKSLFKNHRYKYDSENRLLELNKNDLTVEKYKYPRENITEIDSWVENKNHKTIIEYDYKKQIIRKEEFAENELVEKITCRNSYDSNGELIKSIRFFNDTPFYILTREIISK
jgi:YD repeat-containing protein